MRRKYTHIVLLLTICLLVSVSGCEENNKNTPQSPSKLSTSSGFPMLSYNKDKVLYTTAWGDPRNPTLRIIVAYDLLTKQTNLISPPIKGGYGIPLYSWDGKKITFTYHKGDNSNVCIMDVDGRNYQQLTNDYSDGSIKDTHTGKAKVLKFNSRPSFSPDGKKIIFARAGVERERSFGRGKMFSQWDIYEIEIETKIIRRLTNYQFYDISSPYYMPDGKRFIFWGMAPSSISTDERKKYQERYQDNWIFIMDGEINELKPAIVYGSWTSEPSVTKDGAILFVAKTNEMDGLPQSSFNYDLFLLAERKINRITKQAGYIYNSSISMDGRRITFGSKIEENEKRFVRYYMVNNDGTGLVKITKPVIDMEQIKEASTGNMK